MSADLNSLDGATLHIEGGLAGMCRKLFSQGFVSRAVRLLSRMTAAMAAPQTPIGRLLWSRAAGRGWRGHAGATPAVRFEQLLMLRVQSLICTRARAHTRTYTHVHVSLPVRIRASRCTKGARRGKAGLRSINCNRASSKQVLLKQAPRNKTRLLNVDQEARKTDT